jgi:predicted nucleotidyltransferase
MENNGIWTPNMRDAFIKRGLTSEDIKGNQGYYWFNVMPKNIKPDEENAKRKLVTKALMNTIFANPRYRIIALRIYDILLNKIWNHPITRLHYQKDIIVQLKGGVAGTYLLGKTDDIFPYSDIDIVVFINPNLPKHVFDRVKEAMSIIVLQTISQYKRSIDFMFFSNKERMSPDQIRKQSCEQFLPDDLIDAFKKDYSEALKELDLEDDQSESKNEGYFVSPFENNEIRNESSRHSFMIANSVSHKDSVVRVEVPHFEMCERIPLKRTPLFCSYNKAIRFNRLADADGTRDDKMLVGSFDLFRIRFNNLYMSEDEEAKKVFHENITADFIDIVISNQDDAELHDFWQHGASVLVNDPISNMWIVVPDIPTMISDLDKMLNLYECPEAKRDKRQKRLDVLKNIALSC